MKKFNYDYIALFITLSQNCSVYNLETIVLKLEVYIRWPVLLDAVPQIKLSLNKWLISQCSLLLSNEYFWNKINNS